MFIIVYTPTEIMERIPQCSFLSIVSILLHFLPATSVLHQPAKAFVVREGHHMDTITSIRVNKMAKRPEGNIEK
jgi:hypothetical protein